ncbi:hypothetical protein I3700191H1_04710 [Megasphaera massiliensis]
MAKHTFKFKLHTVKLYLSTESRYENLTFDLRRKVLSVLACYVGCYRSVGIELSSSGKRWKPSNG